MTNLIETATDRTSDRGSEKKAHCWKPPWCKCVLSCLWNSSFL